MASRTIPSRMLRVSASGSGTTKNMAADTRTTTPVWIPSQSLRRPESSERLPVTGASRAMRTPAAVRPQPSQVECSATAASTSAWAVAEPASASATRSRSMKSVEVIHRVNTNVVITALKAAEPQSHRDQATTRRSSRRPVRRAASMVSTSAL